MYEESIRAEFTHQTESFARNRIATAAETLGVVVDLVPEDREASWLEVACGPAVISRALAAKVGQVRGVDLTPAMIEKAGEEAAREGIDNAEFSVGDATSPEFEDASFDGAVTRFSFHHIPAPQRVRWRRWRRWCGGERAADPGRARLRGLAAARLGR